MMEMKWLHSEQGLALDVLMQHFHLALTQHRCRAWASVSGGEALGITLTSHPLCLEAAEIIRDKS